jgi:hypothetical protein
MLEINKFRSSEKKAKTIDGCCFLNLTRPSPWDAKNTSHLAMCFSTRPEGTIPTVPTAKPTIKHHQTMASEGPCPMANLAHLETNPP